ncbi:hypothetical protein SK128_003442 [Halocaridina rubra]|uniref:Uncharacterized protein n=1 Tax=Halocaridina rubra TaxID=373956 RepID=A0AAN8WTM3_HALRR
MNVQKTFHAQAMQKDTFAAELKGTKTAIALNMLKVREEVMYVDTGSSQNGCANLVKKVKYMSGRYNAAVVLSRLPFEDVRKKNGTSTQEIEQCSRTDTEMCDYRKAITTGGWSDLPNFNTREITNTGC